MFKLIAFAALCAVVAAKPGYLQPYSAPIATNTGYPYSYTPYATGPVAFNTVHPYNAHVAGPVVFRSAYPTHASHPIFPAHYDTPVVGYPTQHTAAAPVSGYSALLAAPVAGAVVAAPVAYNAPTATYKTGAIVEIKAEPVEQHGYKIVY